MLSPEDAWNDNAKHQSDDDIARLFVETPVFTKALRAKRHQVVLGSRGSGKTVLLKALSYPVLAKLGTQSAIAAIDDFTTIGIYAPARFPWIEAARIPGVRDRAQEIEYFNFRLNLTVCQQFIRTLRIVISTRFSNNALALNIKCATELRRHWNLAPSAGTAAVPTLESVLHDLDLLLKPYAITIGQARANGHEVLLPTKGSEVFWFDLFRPLRQATAMANEVLQLPDHTKWVLLIDELEWLEEKFWSALNTQMRTDAAGILFKYGSFPTKFNPRGELTGAGLQVGDDFSFVDLDEEFMPYAAGSASTNSGSPTFVADLISKRIELSYDISDSSVGDQLFGHSLQFEPSATLEALGGRKSIDLREMSPKLRRRILEQEATGMDLGDTVWRKVAPLHIVRQEARDSSKGNRKSTIYSGYTMLLRLTDGNPRRAIHLFEPLVEHGMRRYGTNKNTPFVSRVMQNEAALAAARRDGQRALGEPAVGERLAELIDQVGGFFSTRLHSQPLTTDCFTVFECRDTPEVHRLWRVIQAGIDLGLIYKVRPSGSPAMQPRIPGRFRLAFVFYPLYYLPVRRGRSLTLSTVISTPPRRAQVSRYPYQPTLFGKDIDS